MFTQLMINQCAPTLAGIKTGNIFTCKCEDREEIMHRIKYLNNRYRTRGIHFLMLNCFRNKAIIYVFRPEKLRKDFEDVTAKKLLLEREYPVDNIYHSIGMLMCNISQNNEFPHEIGLFLGYPAKDVKGFIENKAENCKYCDLWKVYDDVDNAKRLFCSYRKCRETYCRNFRQFLSIDRLVVAV